MHDSSHRLNGKGANMYSTNLRFAMWCVLSWVTVASYAADSWHGAQIMPKSASLILQVGGPAPPAPTGRIFVPTGSSCTGTVYDVEWPATVDVVEGQWLWVEDRGGYRCPSVSGWVNSNDVLKLADPDLKLHDAYACYTGELKKGNDPWLHWMLGICLENNKETKAACKEYCEALKDTCHLFDLNNTIDQMPTASDKEKRAMATLLALAIPGDAAKQTTDYDRHDQKSNEELREKAMDVAPLFAGKVLEDLAQQGPSEPSTLGYLLDAKIRLERLRAKESESSLDATFAAVRILSVIVLGEKCPRAYYEVAQALRIAYLNKSLEDQKAINEDGDALDKLAEHMNRVLAGLEKLSSREKAENGEERAKKIKNVVADVRDALNEIANDIARQAVIKINPENQEITVDEDDLCQVAKALQTVQGSRGTHCGRESKSLVDFEKVIKDDLNKNLTLFRQNMIESAPPNDDLTKAKADLEKALPGIRLDLDIVWGSRLLVRARSENNLGEFWTEEDQHAPTACADPNVIDEENLLRRADAFYQLAAAQDNNRVVGGGDPSWFMSYLGRGNLQYDRIARCHAHVCVGMP
jgi:hypothetical protein